MSVAMNRVLRGLGWLFIAIGVLVLLYLAYSLLYTNRAASQAQDDLADEWGLELPAGGSGLPSEGEDGQAPPPDPGSAVATLQFRRPGQSEPLVRAEPLYVVEGVSVLDLQRGPGHYPDTALPGGKGNFAVAGHRTTYGAPFFNLDQLRPDDEVVVTARDKKQYVYRVREQRIVGPGDSWVVGEDPLERGKRLLTLTTCHPRFSNTQRMIIFAELVT